MALSEVWLISTPHVFIPGPRLRGMQIARRSSLSIREKSDTSETSQGLGLELVPIISANTPLEVTQQRPKLRGGDYTPPTMSHGKDEDVGKVKDAEPIIPSAKDRVLPPNWSSDQFIVFPIIRKHEGERGTLTHLPTTNPGGQWWGTLPTSFALQDWSV